MYLTRRPAAAAAAVSGRPVHSAPNGVACLRGLQMACIGGGNASAAIAAAASFIPSAATAAVAALPHVQAALRGVRCFSHRASQQPLRTAPLAVATGADLRSLHLQSHLRRFSSARQKPQGESDNTVDPVSPAVVDEAEPTASAGRRPAPAQPPVARRNLPHHDAQRALRQLAQLRKEYLANYPSKAVQLRSGMQDVTLKSHWRQLQTQARVLMRQLLRLASHRQFSISWPILSQMLTAIKNHRLYDLTMPLYECVRQQQSRRGQHFQQHPNAAAATTTATATAQSTDALPIPARLRMPARCVAMLLECVAKSTMPSAAQHDNEEQSDVDSDAAESLLWSMRAPAVRDQFDCDAPEPWNVVLHSLTQSVQAGRDREHVEDQLMRAHSFYNVIPHKDGLTHSMLLLAYQRVGMHADADALRAAIIADPTSGCDGNTHSLTAARLASIYDQLALSLSVLHQVTAAGTALVEEAEQLWRDAALRPQQRLRPAITGTMLKIHHLLGNVERQQAIIQEALQLETTPAHAVTTDASNAVSEPESAPATGSAGPPVFVDAACFGLLIESFASHNPETHVEAAQAAYELMVQRHAQAVEQQQHARALLLWVSDAARATYLKFQQRVQPDIRTPALWSTLTAHQKEGNPRAFVAALNALSLADSSAEAERLVAEHDALGVPWSVQTFNAWLGCYEARGEWQAAEAAWRRLPELGVAPSAISYRKLIQVWMADGSYDQLDKIEPLYEQMSAAQINSQPLQFSAHDFTMIVKTALRCGLAVEAHRWAMRSQAARPRPQQ